MDSEVKLIYRLALTAQLRTTTHPWYQDAVKSVAKRIGIDMLNQPYRNPTRRAP